MYGNVGGREGEGEREGRKEQREGENIMVD